ncbi:glycoside hydrolase family 16 protein [Aurantiacibacter odishensis]|uniref:glycoside hydrolase family 16 protein n=1 Tax=Aurantiacibacter odishensis TaxID=1155476 RepID=UPI001F0C4F05|nr:glycoside hydrolase family 16 protein [Aurantiacibacter odishensis]
MIADWPGWRARGASALLAAMLSACGGGEAPSANMPPPLSTATPIPTPTSSPAASGNWQLVWADEFDAPQLDTSRWNVIADCWGGGNRERQCYTARADNVRVENGALVLSAREESYTGDAWPAHMAPFQNDPDEQKTQDFTSGKITTKGKADWRYGRFEMRARLPQGQGVWPAFWMLPEDEVYGGWPLSGEIDILEAVNLGVECATCEDGGENSILGTLHYGAQVPGNEYTNREVSAPQVLDGDWHTYAVIWEEGRFTWELDGVPYGSIDSSEWWTGASSDPLAPFDRDFHLILNLAVGGNWPESTALGGVSTGGFPKQLEVDWVRVWQCDADAATGRGCTGN